MKVLGLAVLIVACSAGAAKIPASTPALQVKGKASYTVNCLSCHGEKGDGNGPAGQYLTPKPTDFVAGSFKQGEKLEDIFATITNGVKNNPAMRAFKSDLSEEERWALAYYVKAFRKTATNKK